MANTGLIQLGAVRTQAQQRSDQLNSGFITAVEWNSMITASYKELFDLLITSYGDDYMIANPYRFSTSSGVTLYPLPDGSTTTDSVSGLVAVPLYKLVGVDLMVTTAPDSRITLKRFEFTERNNYQQAAQTSYVGGATPIRYRILGANLQFAPTPLGGQNMQLWYIPKPTNLQPIVVGSATSASAVVTVSDTTQLAVGMTVTDMVVPQGGTQVVPTGTTIVSIASGVSFTMSAVALASAPNYLFAAYSDATTFDGISGWEEYVVLDAAIKGVVKEESDPSALMAEKEAMRQRIMATAMGRDASLPSRVSDTQSIDYWNGTFGGFGYDYGGY